MTEYIYIVKCDGCEDEMFNFLTDARMQCDLVMSKHPIITQVEVHRNDFGECTDHCDLGTVWSWEDAMKDTAAVPEKTTFSKDDFKPDYNPDADPEFQDDDFFAVNAEEPKEPVTEATDNSLKTWVCYYDNIDVGTVEATDRDDALEKFADEYRDRFTFDSWDHDWDVEELVDESCDRKPVPEGMSIKQLKETMEENEDTVECAGCEELFPKDECVHKEGIGYLCDDCADSVVKCTWCEELYDKSECRYEVDLGWLCDRCQSGIMSRGEPLTFREGNYWDFLNESSFRGSGSYHAPSSDFDPKKFCEFTYSFTDDTYGDLEAVFMESYADILEALKEIVDDDYIREVSAEDEPKTEAEWKAAGQWDEFFTDDITTHISNLVDELVEYFEEDREEAVKEAVKEAEDNDDGSDPDGFFGWDDFYKWKNGDYTRW